MVEGQHDKIDTKTVGVECVQLQQGTNQLAHQRKKR